MDHKHKHKRHRGDDSPPASHRKHHRHDRDNRDRSRQGSSEEEEEKKPRMNERKYRDEDNRRPKENNRRTQDEHYDRKPNRRNQDEERESHDDRRTKHHNKKHSHRDRGADYDPNIRIKQEKDDENFHHQQRERSHHDRKRKIDRVKREDGGGDFGMNSAAPVKKEEGDGEEEETQEEKEEINMGLTGKLTEDTNTFRGVVIKYNEPPEAMMPRRKWRLYPFKGDESLPVLHIHRQSAFLMGRERRIADIPIDHPSSSKQHAVLQFRAMPYTRPSGAQGRRVRPYIIDLESANGTYLNGDRLEAKRYYELKEKDVVKFGFSTREYVVLHDSVDTSEVEAGEDIEEI